MSSQKLKMREGSEKEGGGGSIEHFTRGQAFSFFFPERTDGNITYDVADIAFDSAVTK